ncbi:MAG TPA: nucleotidyltransferase family protein [Kofleriaceae bacterium]|nr:nucleotidyltransferase family protein [Kofleriaceae bacterium]
MDRSTAPEVAGILLAAGMSRRMGQNKLFLSLDGRTVLDRAVATAFAAGLDPLLVVVGHEADRVRDALARTDAQTVFNPDHARGLNTSLRTGIAALPDGVPAAVVMLADMPLVDAAMIRTLVARWREAGAPLVVSRYGEVIAPPIVYGAALFGELRALDGEGCGKAVIKRHRGEEIAVDWPADRLTDLDVPADLERVAGGGAAR